VIMDCKYGHTEINPVIEPLTICGAVEPCLKSGESSFVKIKTGRPCIVKRRLHQSNRIHQNNQSNQRKKGYSLLEVVVAISILAIIVLAFFPLFTYTFKNIKRAEKIVDASYVAQSTLEELYSRSKDSEYAPPDSGVTKKYDDFGKGYWVVLEIDTRGMDVDAVVTVYADESEKEMKSRMELHLKWK
jgi:prepilin-type N-terminal cleavage/methylation domain-containing protein